MGTCPFSLAVPPPFIYPHPLPAISRANLRLRYYESCTRRVGGRFRTSTPSINPVKGPTSWLSRPVPAPPAEWALEAQSRPQSCPNSQNESLGKFLALLSLPSLLGEQVQHSALTWECVGGVTAWQPDSPSQSRYHSSPWRPNPADG
ncbi:hypothetical protein GOODEAATRI_009328 [Goodea atripinnis]|uniref:Uncharacterized protein n=1 Tax=Goodea atripinnis TaxID=208336 RepID=A0ABV0MZX9_9TELE